jgi:FKBP-type peptidyl-prolyl cis-trans isomerase
VWLALGNLMISFHTYVIINIASTASLNSWRTHSHYKETVLTSNTSLKLTALILGGVLISACNPAPQSTDSVESASVEMEAEAGSPALQTEDEKAAYTLGFSAGQATAGSLSYINDSGIALDSALVEAGFIDALNAREAMDQDTMRASLEALQQRVTVAMQAKTEMQAQESMAANTAYLEANKTKEGVVELESGLQYKVLTAGTGDTPKSSDSVKVHYKGTLVDGTQFDSSYDRGTPAEFGVTQVIRGWTEALQLMKEGGKWQLTIPAELAYGSADRPGIPANSVLLFDVELLEVIAD